MCLKVTCETNHCFVSSGETTGMEGHWKCKPCISYHIGAKCCALSARWIQSRSCKSCFACPGQNCAQSSAPGPYVLTASMASKTETDRESIRFRPLVGKHWAWALVLVWISISHTGDVFRTGFALLAYGFGIVKPESSISSHPGESPHWFQIGIRLKQGFRTGENLWICSCTKYWRWHWRSFSGGRHWLELL
jgi:hypothetical protein